MCHIRSISYCRRCAHLFICTHLQIYVNILAFVIGKTTKITTTSWAMPVCGYLVTVRGLDHRYAQADVKLFSLSARDSKGSRRAQTKIHLNLAKRGAQDTERRITNTTGCLKVTARVDDFTCRTSLASGCTEV